MTEWWGKSQQFWTIIVFTVILLSQALGAVSEASGFTSSATIGAMSTFSTTGATTTSSCSCLAATTGAIGSSTTGSSWRILDRIFFWVQSFHPMLCLMKSGTKEKVNMWNHIGKNKKNVTFAGGEPPWISSGMGCQRNVTLHNQRNWEKFKHSSTHWDMMRQTESQCDKSSFIQSSPQLLLPTLLGLSAPPVSQGIFNLVSFEGSLNFMLSKL